MGKRPRPIPDLDEKTRERLEEYIPDGEPDECWIWMGEPKEDGYPRFRLLDRRICIVAHRLVYTVRVGPIPQGMELLRVCKEKMCVNPSHMRICTRLEVKRHHLGDRCKNGHRYTEKNTRWDSYSGYRLCRTCANARRRERRIGRPKED